MSSTLNLISDPNPDHNSDLNLDPDSLSNLHLNPNPLDEYITRP
jgi:hypothetical protein